MSKLIRILLCCSIFSIEILHNYISAQQDFNDFKILQSSGKIPEDFITRSSLKVQADMQDARGNLTNREKKIFLEGVHYGVDELLQSGMVIYGDAISDYVSAVAEKLLENDKELLKNLRFYTIKSNVSNALSTDQGIVFVTTGLISQLTSEAQLAFILAHEISHYTEKHVVESFEYRTRNKGFTDQIKQLSTYSREKEFEADILGVEMFHKAGYSKKHVLTTFDVLMYSYLPIDEIELPYTYFNSDLCFVPKNKFPINKFPIKAEESYDDSKSSHPNIQKRKEKIIEVTGKINNWGTVNSFLGQEQFEYVRNLSRFERLRSDILDLKYGDALYTIFILEKLFPNSLYLNRMKAQCWLGLSTFKVNNSVNKTVNSKLDLEGEGAAMHYFIKALSKVELTTLAMRIVEDSRRNFPEDKEIEAIWQRTSKNIFDSGIKLSELSILSFNSAISQNQNTDTSILETNEIIAITELTKYERIKQKKSVFTSDGIDSTLYYTFNLSDLIENPKFIQRYKELKEAKNRQDNADKEFNNLSRKDRKRQVDAENRTDISDFILVDPAAISYKRNSVNLAGSEELTTKFSESFEVIAEKMNLKMHTVGKDNLAELGTDGFNEKSIFTTLLIQLSEENDVDIFPVDFSYLEQIQKNYGTSKLVFSIIEHSYRPRFSATAFALIIFPPLFVSYLPLPFILGNRTEINLIVLDIANSKIANGARYNFREPVNRKGIQARIYNIFSTINTKK
jgi:predicted Zn-dependent protease